ncbi:hypothetical protein [Burkholderia thailandensis]|uniref:hypothetical protein n=2 Tax=Burkholderia thailandensis TaxID=57975 RepID=UPI0004F80284|nr:hypothetical protein [Burkholderia thailandensis]MCS6456774.1 hypothetical protein [Burkholderia thailandensis]MCS6486477.1 hypothetical protein [Burkholderia thailandensis]
MPKINGTSTSHVDSHATPTSNESSQPTRRSSSRPTGGSSLSGLHDLSQSTPHSRREHVTTSAAEHMTQPNATYYSAAVHQVSSTLQNNGLGITQRSHDSVLRNLQGIEQGTQTHTGAHMTESRSFGNDAVNHFQRREYLDSAVTAFGSAVNAAASMTVGPARDFETARRHPDPQIAARAAASLHQDFETLPSPTHSK